MSCVDSVPSILLERLPPEQKVGGSNPLGRTKLIKISVLHEPVGALIVCFESKGAQLESDAFHAVLIDLALFFPSNLPLSFRLP